MSTDEVQPMGIWASLASDYLPIMASSVSSERAFSFAGIPISKHHSHLKADVVEALQCLKCMLCHELIFQEPAHCSAIETSLDNEAESENPDWDNLLLADDK